VEADLAYILTAKHVLEGARSINVFFRPRPDTAFVATVVHREQPEGFALLKVEQALPGGVRALPLAADVRLEPGDPVDVIGHSIEAGGDWSAPTGTVSGREGREIQLQVPVKKRNSGGPVLMQGSVVGVVFSEYGVGGKALSARAALEYAEGNRVTPQAPGHATGMGVDGAAGGGENPCRGVTAGVTAGARASGQARTAVNEQSAAVRRAFPRMHWLPGDGRHSGRQFPDGLAG